MVTNPRTKTQAQNLNPDSDFEHSGSESELNYDYELEYGYDPNPIANIEAEDLNQIMIMNMSTIADTIPILLRFRTRV